MCQDCCCFRSSAMRRGVCSAAACRALSPPHPEERGEAARLEGRGGPAAVTSGRPYGSRRTATQPSVRRLRLLWRCSLTARAGRECVEPHDEIDASATMLTDLANRPARFCGSLCLAYSPHALLS